MLSLLVFLLGLWMANQAASAPATQIAGADIAKIVAQLNRSPAEPWVGQTMRVVDAGGYNVGVTIVRRNQPEAESLMHDHVTEIYQMMEGSGTLLTGGTMIDAKPPDEEIRKLAGPGAVGSGIRAGQSRRVAAGDIVIIPTGVPHMFSALDGPITYAIIRVDTDDVLALQ